MNRRASNRAIALGFGLVTGLASAGHAQAQEVSSPAAPAPPPAAPVAPVASSPAAAASAPATATAREDDSPDHERFVGHFAVGYFGITQLPIAREVANGAGFNAGDLQRDTVSAPVVGIRYWFQRNLGIDAGIGLGVNGGSREVADANGTTSIDKKSTFGLAFHGGLPIAFAHGRHYSFLVVPEATVGFTSGTQKEAGTGAVDQNLSGFKLDLGGRIGAEIHFGFIGVPELSLEGSVGVYARRETYKWKRDTVSASDGTTTFGTSVQSDPWAIFVNNISAFYYF